MDCTSLVNLAPGNNLPLEFAVELVLHTCMSISASRGLPRHSMNTVLDVVSRGVFFFDFLDLSVVYGN
jgi:hypothetical protein